MSVKAPAIPGHGLITNPPLDCGPGHGLRALDIGVEKGIADIQTLSASRLLRNAWRAAHDSHYMGARSGADGSDGVREVQLGS